VFYLKNKKLLLRLASIASLFIFCFLIPSVRISFVGTLRYPLILARLARQELVALVNFHRNFIQNERLIKEVGVLRNKLNAFNEVYYENIRLQRLLSLRQESSVKAVSARVIAKGADNWSSVVVIDKGTYHGLRPGMCVINYLGLAGRIMETTRTTSQVMLLNDPSLAVSALVQRTRQEGLVRGALGNNLIMKYLPEGSDIKVGDIIVSSGLNEHFPKGLLIGKVIDVAKESSGLASYAIIKPAVDLASIEEVLVVIP
jgi:rod shape-determining protein MreC